MKCPNCDFDSPPEMRFCGMCGASLTRTCPECGFVNPVSYRFCGMCGTALLNEIGGRPTAVSPRFTAASGAASPAPQPARQPVPSHGTPTPASETTLAGERRVATVLFADVKGSTELLERIGTEAWVEMMNGLFQMLETQVYRYRGEVGQFRGDGLVAFFGAKVANEDDPVNAVLCALAMQEAMNPHAAELASREGIELSIRVGVNTGEIIVASVGDSQYSEDTPMGEALALAARMETAAEPGTVLVSENTYRLAHDELEWLPLGEIRVKGISHPVAVYRPLTPSRVAEPEQDYQAMGFSHGLIGRKTEYQALKKSIEGLYAARGGIMLVTGERGMGKSYLVNQVRQHFFRQNVLLAAAQSKEPDRATRQVGEPVYAGQPIHWLRGRCRSYGHLRPYSMWLDLMHEWIGTHPEDQAGEVQSILRAQMDTDTQWGVDVEKDYPNLAPFLSSPGEETAAERVRHLDAESLKRTFFQTVRNWITQMAEKGPIVISFADMQWADTTSLELLEYCLPLCDTQPILWILVYRPDRESPVWELQHRLDTDYPHRLTYLNIPPLSHDENEEFIDQLVGHEVLQPQTRDLIIKKSEGNPYFIKELILSLIADSALQCDGDKWRQTREVTSLDLPDSLQSLLMARIDRLSSGERRLLQMAAVIGSVFWVNALQATAGPAVSARQLQTDLVSLQRAGIIHERAFVEDLGMEYAFDSSLIREVAYESLLNTQRTAYHLKVAEYLEEIVFQEGKRGYFNTLAHHYRLAGDVKKELFYTFQAAERAQSIYANVEALHYYTRALELLDELEHQRPINGHQRYAILTQKFEALNGRRAVYFLMGNVEAGWDDARALLPLARQMEQDPTWLIDALLQQPGVSTADNREELIAGVPLAQEALEIAQRTGDKRREMNCLLAIASQRNLLNDPTWVEVGDRALALAREIGDRQYEAMILLGLGHSFVGRDELEKGTEYLNAALPICQELDDRIAEMTLLRVLGAQFERSGEHYRRLMEYEQKRLEIARQIGDRFEEGEALQFCGQIIALNLGDLENGLKLVQEAAEILGTAAGKIFSLLRIAQIQVVLGQFEDAQVTLDQSAPVAERNVFDLSRVGLKLVTILLYNALGDTAHLEQVLELTDEIFGMDSSQLISRQYRMAAACEATAAHLALARLAAGEAERQAHLHKAIETSQLAMETYDTFGYVNIVECSAEEIFLRRSQAVAAGGQIVEANQYLEMAYNEMMRKYEMIPADSPFRRTYLENIAHHREIRAAHTAAALAKMTGGRR